MEGEQGIPFRCEFCAKVFGTEKQLRAHRLFHVRRPRETFSTADLSDEGEMAPTPSKRPRLQTKTKMQLYIDDGQQPTTSTGRSSLRFKASQVDVEDQLIDASEQKKFEETKTTEYFHHDTGKMVKRVIKTKVSFTQASKRERTIKQQKKNFSMYSPDIQGKMQKLDELLAAKPGIIEKVYGPSGNEKASKNWRAMFDPENAQEGDVSSSEEEDVESLGSDDSDEEENDVLINSNDEDDDEDDTWRQELSNIFITDPRFSSKNARDQQTTRKNQK